MSVQGISNGKSHFEACLECTVQENVGVFVILLLGEADGNNSKPCQCLNPTPMNPALLGEDCLEFYF